MRESWCCRGCSHRWQRSPDEPTIGCPRCRSPDTLRHVGCIGDVASLVGVVASTFKALAGILRGALSDPKTLLKILVILVLGIAGLLAELFEHGFLHGP